MSRRLPVCILAYFAVTLPSPPTAIAEEGLGDLSGPWQLFVDDHLVAERDAAVARTYHPFQKHADNPILTADKPWEGTMVYIYGTVLRDPVAGGYRMWYHSIPGDERYRLLYATSTDGIHWTKPDLGIVTWNGSTNNNIFIRRSGQDHIPSILHTPWEPDAGRRYKLINYDGEVGQFLGGYSADGLHWTDVAANPILPKASDVGNFAWDPHTRRYVGYMKVPAYVNDLKRRAVGFTSTADFESWPAPDLVLAPDAVDDRWVPPGTIQRTHFYGLCGFAYESMYLGFLWVFRATDKDGYYDGTIFVELVSSRDGIHWQREEGDRPAILALGPDGTWDDGMIFTTQHPLVEGDTIKLYYGGCDITHASKDPGNAAIGLATLRKDGFASLDAGNSTGTVTTAPLAGTGGPLHVNYHAKGGRLQVEVLDENGNVVSGYSRTDCNALSGDRVDHVVAWGTKNHLPAEAGLVKLRFVMQNASLYSFFLAPADCNGNGTNDAEDITAGSSPDCNSNGIPDECDLTDGGSGDANANGVPDECDPDCNRNDVPDDLDVIRGTATDCNHNGIPDECDLADGTLADANGNGVADKCEPDCDGNGTPDSADIAAGTSRDCNRNGVPDECDVAAGTSDDTNGNTVPDECDPDCNKNGIPDDLDLARATALDCNRNGIPDVCDIESDASGDTDANGVPDECDPDCNRNGVPDVTDVSEGGSTDCDANDIPDECQADCNGNGTPDACDIADGTSRDCNTNGIPDECDLAAGRLVDANGDGIPDPCQAMLVIAVQPAGGGSVKRSPDKDWYVPGEPVELTATPAEGWRFAGWSGDLAALAGTISLDLNRNTSLTATFENPPPVVSIGGPYRAAVNEPIRFDGSTSRDPLGEVLSLTWDFGDGTTAEGLTPSHGYAQAGSYEVTLIVADPQRQTATAKTRATITTAPPPDGGDDEPPPPDTPPAGSDKPAPSAPLTGICGMIDLLTMVLLFAGLWAQRRQH